MSKIIKITITSPKYKTLGNFLLDPKSPGFPGKFKIEQNKNPSTKEFNAYAQEFLKFTDTPVEGVAPKSNYDVILEAFKNFPEYQKIIENSYTKGDYLDMLIKPGIIFSIPLERITKEALLTQGIETISNNDPAFKAQVLVELESDVNYKQILKNSHSRFGDLKVLRPNITVWIWCRSLSENSQNELSGQIFNITPFVTSLQTNHSKGGSTFSLSLAPINASLNDATGQWEIKDKSLLINESTKEYIATSTLNEIDPVSGDLVRSKFFFHNTIQSNDLIFIRYETLENEEQQRIQDNKHFNINKKDLAGRIYDMIGLVDRNILSNQHDVNDVTIQVSGRDLSKLFIEDGTYFYAYEAKQGVLQFQGGSTRSNDLIQRIIGTNSMVYLGLYYNNSIEDILKFVIQQLSTIKVAPDELFTSYSLDSRNQDGTIKETDQNVYKPEELKDRRNWSVKDAFISDSDSEKAKALRTDLEKRRQDFIQKEKNLVNDVFTFRKRQFVNSTNITLKQSEVVYQSLKRFVRTLILEKTDAGRQVIKIDITGKKISGWQSFIYEGELIYEDLFPSNFVLTDPTISTALFNDATDRPYRTISDIQELLQKTYLLIKEEAEFKKADFVQEPFQVANGIWQIVKLVIDKKVANRLLIDSSFSQASGSLMNFLKKACQEPFVEIFMDTYKDQFFITVRQPPTDKVGMRSHLLGIYQSANDDVRDSTGLNNLDDRDNTTTRNVVVNIEEIDVISDSLSFDESCIYSWYHFVPQANIQGSAQRFSTHFIPAIYFPEYAEIWGSKSLDLIHNYTNYYLQYGKELMSKGVSDENLQLYKDMKFVVDSNMYMPFSRKGSITMKNDRRLKVGNPVRLKSTGEIFWIDSISRAYTIGTELSSTATIQVSRGLVESFIEGVSGAELNKFFSEQGIKFSADKKFSYFDIINTELNLEKTTKKTKIKKERKVLINPNEVAGGGLLPNEMDAETETFSTNNYTKMYGDFSNNQLNKSLVTTTLPLDIEFELNKLDPSAQPHFRKFLKQCIQMGWNPIITSGRRNKLQQAVLFARNKDKSKGEKNASPEKSKHVIGFALDLNFIASKKVNSFNKGYHLKKGNNVPERQYWNNLWRLSGIPQLAASLGFVWGGNYPTYKDNVHFEMNSKYISNFIQTDKPVPQYRTEYYEVDGPDQLVVDQDKIFSNFKVDKEIFNFFIRHQQFAFNSKVDLTVKENVNNVDDLIEKAIISPEQLNNLTPNAKKEITESFTTRKLNS